jgi:uncharacterized repeat protein (TIGR03843 family)
MKLSESDILTLLSEGAMESLGLLPWSSNYTFLTKITPTNFETFAVNIESSEKLSDEQFELLAVYKPRQGEAPLWDFPEGTLCLREAAAYRVSESLGWNLIPPTALRQGPHGFGSVQLYVENDPNKHFFTFREDPALVSDLQRLVAFDLITNNADRKSGHCLLSTSGKLWAIDHGITFNCDYKLRTVIWDFANQPIPVEMLDDLNCLLDNLAPPKPLYGVLESLLNKSEIKAFRRRVEGLIKLGYFPSPSRGQRSIPWPPV